MKKYPPIAILTFAIASCSKHNEVISTPVNQTISAIIYKTDFSPDNQIKVTLVITENQSSSNTADGSIIISQAINQDIKISFKVMDDFTGATDVAMVLAKGTIEESWHSNITNKSFFTGIEIDSLSIR